MEMMQQVVEFTADAAKTICPLQKMKRWSVERAMGSRATLGSIEVESGHWNRPRRARRRFEVGVGCVSGAAQGVSTFSLRQD